MTTVDIWKISENKGLICCLNAVCCFQFFFTKFTWSREKSIQTVLVIAPFLFFPAKRKLCFLFSLIETFFSPHVLFFLRTDVTNVAVAIMHFDQIISLKYRQLISLSIFENTTSRCCLRLITNI